MNLCPCCRKPKRIYTQASLIPNRPAREYAECVNPACQIFAVTLVLGAHERLTDEQVESYAAVNQQRRMEGVRA